MTDVQPRCTRIKPSLGWAALGVLTLCVATPIGSAHAEPAFEHHSSEAIEFYATPKSFGLVQLDENDKPRCVFGLPRAEGSRQWGRPLGSGSRCPKAIWIDLKAHPDGMELAPIDAPGLDAVVLKSNKGADYGAHEPKLAVRGIHTGMDAEGAAARLAEISGDPAREIEVTGRPRATRAATTALKGLLMEREGDGRKERLVAIIDEESVEGAFTAAPNRVVSVGREVEYDRDLRVDAKALLEQLREHYGKPAFEFEEKDGDRLRSVRFGWAVADDGSPADVTVSERGHAETCGGFDLDAYRFREPEGQKALSGLLRDGVVTSGREARRFRPGRCVLFLTIEVDLAYGEENVVNAMEATLTDVGALVDRFRAATFAELDAATAGMEAPEDPEKAAARRKPEL